MEEVAAKSDRLTATEFILEEGVTSIGRSAFHNYRQLIRVTVPKTVKEIDATCFRYCKALQSIDLDHDNPYLELDEYGAIYYKGKEVLIKVPGRKSVYIPPPNLKIIADQALSSIRVETIVIPKTVVSVGTYSCVDSTIKYLSYEKDTKINGINTSTFTWSGLYTITIPPSVTFISDTAFSYCIYLSNVIFEQGSKLENISRNAFVSTIIKNFTFPPNTAILGPYIFNMNTKLETIHIPLSLTRIDIQTFAGCSSIKKITIDDNHTKFSVIAPATLLSIDGNQIYYIYPEVTSLEIPAGMASVPETLLQSCLYLTNLTVAKGNKNFYAEGGILYSANKVRVFACAGGIKEAILRSEVININQYAFSGLTNLTKITVNDGCTTLGAYAFFQTQNLGNVTFPASLQIIYSYAFKESSIKYVFFKGEGPQTLYGEIFMNSQLQEISFGRNLADLGNLIFYSCPLRKITFDSDCGITRFTNRMFVNTKLESIKLPKNITILEDEVFNGVASLKELIIPADSKLITIGNLVFFGCQIKTINIPKSVTSIGSTTFAGNDALTSLAFENDINITEFGSYAWKDCNSLTTVTIPLSITSFDASIFLGCGSLSEINFPTENKFYKSSQGIVYNIDGTKLVACPAGVKKAEIENTITIIGSNAFYKCTQLKTLTFMPGSCLEYIEEGTFYLCTSLTRVDLPVSLRTVQRNAFAGCTSLSIITLPDNSLCDLNADSIFEDCVSLQIFTFGKFCALTVLGTSTFKGCVQLQNITIPANCTTIGANCFEGCVSLNLVAYEPGSHLNNIGDDAFLQCTSLVDYHVPDAFDTISSNVFGNAPSIVNVYVSANKQIQYISSDAFSSFPIQNIYFGSGTTVNAIQESAFENKPLKSFIMNSPMTIGLKAFKSCINLTKVSINGVTKIGNYAFSGCSILEGITIPASCTDIGTNCFEYCSKLSNVKIETNSVLQVIRNYAFLGCDFSTFSLPQTVETFGVGVFQNCAKLTTFIFLGESTISSISQNLFKGCSSLISITIPSSATGIGNSAFEGCSSLTSIEYKSQSKITSIGTNAFSGCTKLTTFPIPYSITTISSSTFGNAPSIIKVILDNNAVISSIQSNSFTNIDLRHFVVGESIKISSIESSAFANTKIENFTVSCPISIKDSAFKDCSHLSSVSFGEIQSLGSSAFANCTLIESLSLSFDLKVKTIPASAFENCTKLRYIDVIGKIESIESNAFKNCESLDFQRIDTITSIGDFSFYKCGSIKLPPKLKSVGQYAFYGTLVNDSYGKAGKRAIILPSSLTSIGSLSFFNTGIKIVMYCGDKDFSENRRVFPPNTEVRTTFKYEHSTMFTLNVNHYEGTSCESLYATGINNAADFREMLLEMYGGAIQVFVIITM